MFDYIRADFRRASGVLAKNRSFKAYVNTALSYGFLAVLVYRYGRFANRIQPRILGVPFRIVYWILNRISEMLFGIFIDVNSNIGPGFYVAHFSCIFVVGNLGRNCTVHQGVTIGYRGNGKSDGCPTLGDNVFVGVGAKIIGKLRIGDNAVVGANAVVLQDVPADSLAVGVPARVIPRKAGRNEQATEYS